jgi:tRNA modification GTPase
LELQLDFSEEDISVASSESVSNALEKCIEEMESVLSSYSLGRRMRDGASVTIVGRPNVGKSSLFNRLLMEDRSIVSSSPGTTRDFLEESVAINGMEVRLFDTAGLRVSADAVEADGVQRTKSVIRSSDLVVLVTDSSTESTASADLLEISSEVSSGTKVLVVGNKMDLGIVKAARNPIQIYISAVTGEGVQSLRNGIFEGLVSDCTGGEPDYCLSSSRHCEVLGRCIRHANTARRSLQDGTPIEFVCSEIRIAVNAIGEISGEITTDDILNTIFSRFCIGK